MQALGKVFFFIFSGEFFVEGLDHSPRQRPVFYFFLRNSLPRVVAKALGKDLIIVCFWNFFAEGYGQGPRQRPEKFYFFLFVYFHPDKRQIHIYIPSHRVHNKHIHLINITYIYHEHNVCTSSSPQVHQIEPKFQTTDIYAP